MYDVIVVGSGATGSWAALALARVGARVLVLEAGPEITDADLARLGRRERPAHAPHQPIQSQLPGFGPVIAPLLIDDALHPYALSGPGPFAWVRSRQLGGRTLLWGGVTPRLTDADMRDPSTGLSPWPFAHAELELHYDEAEKALGVTGNSPRTPAEDALAGAAKRIWPDDPMTSRPGITCWPSRVDGLGRTWPAGATPPTLLADARRRGVTVRADSIVASLLLDNERVRGVRIIDRQTHEPLTLHAETVVLCASTIESTRILLNSRNSDHPRGVGASSGLLGRYLMDHPAFTVRGTATEFAAPADDLPLGGPYGIRLMATDRRYQLEGWAQRRSGRPGEPAEFTLAVSAEMDADNANAVSIDPSMVDAWGIPAVSIRFAYGAGDHGRLARAESDVRDLCDAVGFDITAIARHYAETGSYVHEVGTARMGSSPQTSVLDPWNRVWDAPNVLVTDGACWPACPAPNPTLTMMAITGRACAALAR